MRIKLVTVYRKGTAAEWTANCQMRDVALSEAQKLVNLGTWIDKLDDNWKRWEIVGESPKHEFADLVL